jgi:putative nucleotidyltransferase with HDIG domain
VERRATGEKLRRSLEGTIGAIGATMESRDPYTAGHQRRVAELAAAMALEMGLPAQVVEGVHFGALIHDLGKIQVPAEILSKPSRLSKLEFELIKSHAQTGYDIVKEIEFPWPIAEMVYQHHERLDGSGYPQGLKGDEITLEARILSVADVVEAMSSHRPYRPGLGLDAALEEIGEQRGKGLDADAVDACTRLFRDKRFAFKTP